MDSGMTFRPKGLNADRMRFLGAVSLLALLSGCGNLEIACTCDEEIRMNVCVAGKYAGRDSITYWREAEKDGVVDSAEAISPACFREMGGRQRILVIQGESRVDSSAWFRQEEADCCHYREKTIPF